MSDSPLERVRRVLDDLYHFTSDKHAPVPRSAAHQAGMAAMADVERGYEQQRHDLDEIHTALAEANVSRSAGVDEPLWAEAKRVRLLRERAESAESKLEEAERREEDLIKTANERIDCLEAESAAAEERSAMWEAEYREEQRRTSTAEARAAELEEQIKRDYEVLTETRRERDELAKRAAELERELKRCGDDARAVIKDALTRAAAATAPAVRVAESRTAVLRHGWNIEKRRLVERAAAAEQALQRIANHHGFGDSFPCGCLDGVKDIAREALGAQRQEGDA